MTNGKKQLMGFVASSASPDEISSRVKGAILALSGLIIYLGTNFFNIQLSATDVIDLATQLSVIAGAVWTIWGAGCALVRKFATV